jgi:uncharacterized protein YjbI with pentapeptide repeats
MPENISICRIHEKHSTIKCQNSALPGDPDELCILHSEDKEKNRDGSFTAAVQEKLKRQDYDFRGVFFPSAIDFKGRKFSNDVYFYRAIFNDNADFSGATFCGEANFLGATFQKIADFRKINILRRFLCSIVIFNGDVDFCQSEFKGPVYFARSQFSGNTCFRRSKFNDEARFKSVTFSDSADFKKAIFLGESNFRSVNFAQYCDFREVDFLAKAIFFGASFPGRADFSGATFSSETQFYGVIFSGAAQFYGTNFYGETDFREAKIKNRATFASINSHSKDKRNKPFRANFKFINLGLKALRFKDLSLSNIQLSGTDLRQIEFEKVDWSHYFGRNILYDEILLNEKERARTSYIVQEAYLPEYYQKDLRIPISPSHKEYDFVERLYRQLKINFEKEYDYKSVGDFHYGEMEMHRRASKWRWFPFYWYNLYRWLSGYGERPSWALGWLVAFLVGLAGLVWGLGLEVGKRPHTHIADFGDSFIYLLQKATLQRPTWAEPVGFWGKLVAGLSVLLIPGQAALFLLALRNRLGRRR